MDYAWDDDDRKEFLAQFRNFGNGLDSETFDKWSKEINEHSDEYDRIYTQDPRENALVVGRMALTKVQAREEGDSSAEHYLSYVQKRTGMTKAQAKEWKRRALADDRLISSRG
jgi:hypothetical protein